MLRGTISTGASWGATIFLSRFDLLESGADDVIAPTPGFSLSVGWFFRMGRLRRQMIAFQAKPTAQYASLHRRESPFESPGHLIANVGCRARK